MKDFGAKWFLEQFVASFCSLMMLHSALLNGNKNIDLPVNHLKRLDRLGGFKGERDRD